MYDVIVIGAGPAGLTSAIYLLRNNKKVLVFESEGIGGQIASSPLIENYPGFIKISGAELSNNLYEQVINLNGEIELEKVIEIKDTIPKEIITEENKYFAKAVIVATGAKYRLLGLPNEEKYIGNGISFCTTCDGTFYKNKVIAVVGGGSSAITNALYMSDMASEVYLIHRNENFRSEKYLLDKLRSKKNVKILTNTNITSYLGDNSLEGVILNDKDVLKLEGIFLSIGHTPQNEMVKDLLKLSENKYVLSNENCETNIEGIFVAGDVKEKTVRQITTAVSDGSVAALSAIKYIDELK